MRSRVLLFSKRTKPAAREASQKLAEWLKTHDIDVIDMTDSEGKLGQERLRGVHLGVVIGGDGTLLTLVRRLEKKDQFPLMGVNLGSLGFITEIGRDEMISAMQDFLNNAYTEEHRRLLHVELWRSGKCLESGIVFNDAVVTKDARTTMLKFDVSVGGDHLSYVRADGYIVSTPTGSTAYALSAGGPLLHPMVNATLLVPICSHALSARPILVPDVSEVEILLQEFQGKVYLVYDGQVTYEMEKQDVIKIRSSESSLRLIRTSKQKWPEAIRSKLKMS